MRGIALLLMAVMSFSFISDEIPAPQSLVVTLTGYRDTDNNLKCKLYYMTTLPDNTSKIKNVHLVLEKPIGEFEKEKVTDITVPFDWEGAQGVKDVVSFYTTRNILYIGVGEFDLLRNYECKISFIDETGKESRAAIYKK